MSHYYDDTREKELELELKRERERGEILEKRNAALESALRRAYEASSRTGRQKQDADS